MPEELTIKDESKRRFWHKMHASTVRTAVADLSAHPEVRSCFRRCRSVSLRTGPTEGLPKLGRCREVDRLAPAIPCVCVQLTFYRALATACLRLPLEVPNHSCREPAALQRRWSAVFQRPPPPTKCSSLRCSLPCRCHLADPGCQRIRPSNSSTLCPPCSPAPPSCHCFLHRTNLRPVPATDLCRNFEPPLSDCGSLVQTPFPRRKIP